MELGLGAGWHFYRCFDEEVVREEVALDSANIRGGFANTPALNGLRPRCAHEPQKHPLISLHFGCAAGAGGQRTFFKTPLSSPDDLWCR